MDHVTWENIYSLPHELLKCNKTKELQYKILHRYIGTNKLLFKIGKAASARCVFCELYDDDIEHLFFDCLVSKNFWIQVWEAWNKINVLKVAANRKDVILGYNIHQGFASNVNKILNLVILHGKSFIFKCKFNNVKPDYFNFKNYMKEIFKVLHYDESLMIVINQTFLD